MAVRRISAETLIEVAIATLRRDLQPILPADHRYTAAMIANGLEIARREIVADGEPMKWALLDDVYPDGDGDTKRLAADIRAGTVSTKTMPDLAARLRAVLVEELQVRNPKFLQTLNRER